MKIFYAIKLKFMSFYHYSYIHYSSKFQIQDDKKFMSSFLLIYTNVIVLSVPRSVFFVFLRLLYSDKDKYSSIKKGFFSEKDPIGVKLREVTITYVLATPMIVTVVCKTVEICRIH